MSEKNTFGWKSIAVICIALLIGLVAVMTANAAITLTDSDGANTSLGKNVTEHGDASFLNFSAQDDGAITALNLSFPTGVTLPIVTDLNYSWVGLDCSLDNLSISNNVLNIDNGSTTIATASTEFSINITNITYNWGALSNGTYIFNLNTSNTSANTPIYLTIDGEPTVSVNTYLQTPNTWVKNGTILDFNASISDIGSGVVNATIDITALNSTDGIINLDLLSGYWVNTSYLVSTQEGRHNITIVSYDAVGHVNNSVNFSVWVDNTAPVESATITHTDDAPAGYDNDTTVNIGWSAVSGADSYNLYRNGVFNTSVSGTSTTFTESDGTYTYNVSAVDAASNEGPQNSTGVTVIVDTATPTVTLSTTASDPTGTSPIPVTATFNESVTGFVLGDITVGNGSAVNFAGSGTTYTFDVTPSADGLVTVDIASDVA